MSSIDFDEVLVHVGEKGRYQNIMYYLLCIPATLPAVFLAFSQLDLVCDNSWWPSTSTTFFYVGSLFGNVVFGWIADKWGRRTAVFAILFLEVPFSIATSFSPNYVIYTALRTVNGLFFPAIYQIPFILALELMGPRYRTFAGMVISMFFATAMSLLALLGYLLRHWYTLSLATSVPFILLFSYYWIIPESPRWLLSKNRIDEAEVIVQHMAKVNGKTVPTNFLRKMEVEILKRQGISCNGKNSNDGSIDVEGENRSPPSSATPMDLIRNPNIRKKFFILAFDWVANAVVYNGLSYNTTNLGVSDYLAFFIGKSSILLSRSWLDYHKFHDFISSEIYEIFLCLFSLGGIVEIPSYFITWYAMDRLGRRWVLCMTMMLGGLACVSCMFVPEADAVWVTVSLAMIGKFGIAASFAVFYVFVGELLPTVLRSQAMGIASFIAGIGLLTFPYIVHLAEYSRVLPLIVMGSLSVAGALTSVFLPETLNIHLPQTIEEGEQFGADFKLWSCPTLPRLVILMMKT
ncbi:hypothetical protein ACFW04_004254 [Cataglyphis niger]